MRKRTIVFILGLLVFFAGIVLISLSGISKNKLVPFKQVLVRYTAQNFTEAVLVGPFISTTGGINISDCEGYEGQPLFFVWNFEGYLIYSGPAFPPSSYNIEFGIPQSGYYTIEFNFIMSDDSCIEVYDYRSQIKMVRPFGELYEIGLLVAVSGIVVGTIGMFLPSKAEES